MDAALVMHGHFYQPPREDPWSGQVPVEPSAGPYRDWNHRITAECYRPNGAVPLVGDGGRVEQVVDNYRQLSYNVGPTLLSWLEDEAPDVHHRMVEADRGAGHALAQAYGHAILPLCNDRDLRTHVRWGLADFRHRFGREAAGMWLPETAVDERTLAVLAEEGVGFTILAAHQVIPVDDPDGRRRPTYRWQHPDRPDLGLSLVAYDPGLSHDVAFGGLGSRELIDRAIAASADNVAAHGRGPDGTPDPGAALVVVACDGETFGHHQRFAELGLAHALAVEAPRRAVQLPDLAHWLKDHPPSVRATVQTSAWSCAHGVGRWLEDCGCHTGGEETWNQRWRGPLRAALDILRDHAAAVFEHRGSQLLHDPWASRDTYIDVLSGARPLDELLAQDGRNQVDVDGDRRAEVATLLELQRSALFMYTSCGWFFNDLAGLETVQVLRYAGRACDLLDDLGETGPYDEFFTQLGQAWSNRPQEGSGRDIWARHVEPWRQANRTDSSRP